MKKAEEKIVERRNRKNETIKQRFGDNVLFNDYVKNLNYLNGCYNKNGILTLPKFAKLVFYDKEITHKNNSKGVVCKLMCRLIFDVPAYMYNRLLDSTEFSVTGIAVCSDEDTFDLDKGIRIAQAKAENEAYRVAREMCKTIKDQFTTFANALTTPTNNFDKYIEHNKEFIDKVLRNEIKRLE